MIFAQPWTNPMNKFGAKKVVEDAIEFDSKFERDTYLELKRLHDNGVILGIVHQYKYLLRSYRGAVIGHYCADFRCLLATGKVVVVETKGFETALWRRTKRHFLADYTQVELVVVKDRSQFPLELTAPAFALAKKTPAAGRRADQSR